MRRTEKVEHSSKRSKVCCLFANREGPWIQMPASVPYCPEERAFWVSRLGCCPGPFTPSPCDPVSFVTKRKHSFHSTVLLSCGIKS